MPDTRALIDSRLKRTDNHTSARHDRERARFGRGLKTHAAWETGAHRSMPKGAPGPRLTTKNTIRAVRAKSVVRYAAGITQLIRQQVGSGRSTIRAIHLEIGVT